MYKQANNDALGTKLKISDVNQITLCFALQTTGGQMTTVNNGACNFSKV